MLDSFSRAVLDADAQTAYVEGDRLARLRQFAASHKQRITAVELMRQQANDIIAQAISMMVAENPELIQQGGNCYPSRRMATCIRDGEFILRYVSYALLAGDGAILEQRCLEGLKETYQTLGVPLSSAVGAIAEMKAATLSQLDVQLQEADVSLTQPLLAEVADYFEIAIAALR
ncbi:bleomycin hydrolase [Geitlerinema sp. P-1104]|uniref:bleomycin hydrolase n=1 Tax=Geitlerinema sp. P-1104 TaxID=2546230 RepID=UPI0014774309|nr:bleomycin hydrolase [Geitlerinema sp. P-1104]